MILLIPKKNRKGNIDLNAVLTGFLIVAVVLFLLVMIIFIFGNVYTDLEFTADSQSVASEPGAYINATGYQLASGVTGTPRTFSISTATNTTGGDGTVIASGNWTISSTGLVTNATPTTWSAVNFTYTYSNDSAEQTASITSQTNTSRAIPLVGILFIILAVGALITILIVSITGKRRS